MSGEIDHFAEKFFPRIVRRVRRPDGSTEVVVAAPAARTRHPDGSVEFVCTGCACTVVMAIDDGCEFCVCADCRWFGERPWMDTRGKQRQGSVVPPLRLLGLVLLGAGIAAFFLAAVVFAPRCTPGHEVAIGGAVRISGCQQGGRP